MRVQGGVVVSSSAVLFCPAPPCGTVSHILSPNQSTAHPRFGIEQEFTIGPPRASTSTHLTHQSLTPPLCPARPSCPSGSALSRSTPC